VVVGNETLYLQSAATLAPWNNNSKDTATAATVTAANRELTWSVRNASTTAWNWSEVLGTSNYPDNTDSSIVSTEDIRHFMAPANGRWTINPLYKASNSPTGSTPTNSATAEMNTRAIMLSLGGTSGKTMEMRLAGDTVNNAAASGNYSYYNSLMGFDLTDNQNSTQQNPFVEYYDNNNFNLPQSLWHPQTWYSMTIYTQANTEATTQFGVDTRMVFGPYLHTFRLSGTYTSYGCYWNWGRYVGNPWYGQTAGDFNRAFPGNAGEAKADLARRGMAYIPEYYGNDAQFMLLDSSTKPVLFIQGVNILDQNDNQIPSAIYSRRAVEIGGALVKTTSAHDNAKGQTTRHVNSNVDGYSYGYAAYYLQYFGSGPRYSQILYNTDIVLRTPQGTDTPRQSRIFDATLPTDGVYNDINSKNDAVSTNNFSSNADKQFSPTVRIIGGDIYVDAGQTLTIDGGRINPKGATSGTVTAQYPAVDGRTITLSDTRGEYTQVIAPDSITVAEGATLILRGQANVDGVLIGATSQYANVNTPIYVEGTLNLTTGARLTNRIYVYGKGVVNVQAAASGPAIVDRRPGDEGIYDGIYAFGGGTVNIAAQAQLQSRIWVDAESALTIGNGAVITGDLYVLGTLTIPASFQLNYDSRDLVDNPNTADVLENQPDTHGIYLYDDPALGSATLLHPSTPIVSGNSGRIHSFAAHPDMTGATAAAVFCDNRDEGNNACQHWLTANEFWVRQGTSGE
jgi:hypothetical protein